MSASFMQVPFLEAAPNGASRALALLAVPESLTDQVAAQLYELAPIKDISPAFFLAALDYSNLTSSRTGEWHLDPTLRSQLYREAVLDTDLFKAANILLLDYGKSSPEEAGKTVPRYLFTQTGLAYHRVALDKAASLHLYIEAFKETLDSERWLASKLASLQQQTGLIPLDAVEPAFMRGMILYRDGHRGRALEILGQVAEVNSRTWEIAVAKHLVGNSLRESSPGKALNLLQESLSISIQIEDLENRLQVMNSLGTLLRGLKMSSALEIFREGLELAVSAGDLRNEAVFASTYGNALAYKNPDLAEQLLERAIELSRRLGDVGGEARSLHSLSRIVKRSRPALARELVKLSVELGRDINDRRHLAQALRSLGLLYREDNIERSMFALEESAKLNIEDGNRRGAILALTALGQVFVAAGDSREAERIFHRVAVLAGHIDQPFENTQLEKGVEESESYLFDGSFEAVESDEVEDQTDIQEQEVGPSLG